MTIEIVDDEPRMADRQQRSRTEGATKHKGPMLLRRGQVQASTTDQRLLDTRDE